MALADLVPMVPAVPINRYLWSKIAELDPDLVMEYNGVMPFFPLGESASGENAWDGHEKPTVVYDRMMVINPSPFYPIKKEQIHYAIKANPSDSIVWGSAFQYILDGMDDVAQEINKYNKDKDYGLFPPRSALQTSPRSQVRGHRGTIPPTSSTSPNLSLIPNITTIWVMASQ